MHTMTPQSQRQTIQKLHAALGSAMKVLDELKADLDALTKINRQLAAQLAELISKTKSGD